MAARKGTRQEGAQTDATLNPVEVRLTGGPLALNRFFMTLQNKRMPVSSFTLGKDGGVMRVTILLDCPPESARRYTTLLSALEDVEEIEAAEALSEVALLKMRGDAPHEAAERAGVSLHEDGDMVVASGEPGALSAWLYEVEGDVEDLIRLGPVARPRDGGS